MHDPAARSWRTWKVPGASPHSYAVYVDDRPPESGTEHSTVIRTA